MNMNMNFKMMTYTYSDMHSKDNSMFSGPIINKCGVMCILISTRSQESGLRSDTKTNHGHEQKEDQYLI